MAFLLNRLIFDELNGNRILSLLLFTLYTMQTQNNTCNIFFMQYTITIQNFSKKEQSDMIKIHIYNKKISAGPHYCPHTHGEACQLLGLPNTIPFH